MKKEKQISDLIKEYIKESLKKLKKVGDKVELKNVYPEILDQVLNFNTIYDIEGLNSYDGDYQIKVGKYYIFGSMRFGTASIELINTKEYEEEKENKNSSLIPESSENWNTYYFVHELFNDIKICMPIKAENEELAKEFNQNCKHPSDISIDDFYTEEDWNKIKDSFKGEILDTAYYYKINR